MINVQLNWIILSVFVLPLPPRHPVTTTMLSPFLHHPLLVAISSAFWMRVSTSIIHSSPELRPAGFGSSISTGNTPRHKCIWRAATSLRVTPKMGHRGLYLETRWAELRNDKQIFLTMLIKTATNIYKYVWLDSLLSRRGENNDGGSPAVERRLNRRNGNRVDVIAELVGRGVTQAFEEILVINGRLGFTSDLHASKWLYFR